jgi:hypothetical protein
LFKGIGLCSRQIIEKGGNIDKWILSCAIQIID